MNAMLRLSAGLMLVVTSSADALALSYTDVQAETGAALYQSACANCHSANVRVFALP